MAESTTPSGRKPGDTDQTEKPVNPSSTVPELKSDEGNLGCTPVQESETKHSNDDFVFKTPEVPKKIRIKKKKIEKKFHWPPRKQTARKSTAKLPMVVEFEADPLRIESESVKGPQRKQTARKSCTKPPLILERSSFQQRAKTVEAEADTLRTENKET